MTQTVRTLMLTAFMLAAVAGGTQPVCAQVIGGSAAVAGQRDTPSFGMIGGIGRGRPQLSCNAACQDRLDIDADDLSDANSDIVAGAALAGGVFIRVPATSLVGVRLEGLFAQQRYTTHAFLFDECSPFSNGCVTTVTTRYLDIPLLIHVTPARGTGIRPFLVAGPAISVLVSARAAKVDVTDQLKRITAALAIGGGFERARFLVEARYHRGFGTVLGDDVVEDLGPNTPPFRNSAFWLLAGYRFR